MVDQDDDFPRFNEFLLATNTFELKTFNVGQGNCIMLKAPNDVFTLIDAGTTSSTPGAASIKKSVASAMGSNKFDNIVLTHPDDDHCNLVPELPSANSPQRIHYSMDETDYSAAVQNYIKKVPNQYYYPKDYWSSEPSTLFGETPTNFDIYVLYANKTGNANTHSMVLSIDCGNQVLVLTGDATSSTERAILSEWDLRSLKTTLLVFGHHGSNHSSSNAFIMATKPEIGVFSASARHMGYGHPRCSVYQQVLPYIATLPGNKHKLTCFEDAKTGYVTHDINEAVFCTADSGLIEYRSDGKTWSMT